MSELRFNPFLSQWTIIAAHRQDRTYFPPADSCPLCPTVPGEAQTEIPFADYQVAVFENRFPSLTSRPEAAASPGSLLKAAPAHGVCEVVCYTPDHDRTFADLSRLEANRLAHVWRDRYAELIKRPGVEYVFIFENRGKEIGVTLTHPHGQIYAYPFVPPLAGARLDQEKRHWETYGRNLSDDWLAEELGCAVRIVWQSKHFVTLCPYFSRFPYEVHVVATTSWPSLCSMTNEGLEDLADSMLKVANAYDRLFGFPLPYIMAMHQHEADYTRFRVEFTPLHRTESKLKFLAGSETAMGAFILDVPPEEAASRLRDCIHT